MKKCNINDIKGGEILASPILTSEYQILLTEGTVLQASYIEKFRHLEIETVYIQEENEKERTEEEIREFQRKTQNKVEKQVRRILESHIYQRNEELQKLDKAATELLDDILKEKNIIDQLIEMEERSADLYEHAISCCVLSTILSLRLQIGKKRIHAISVGCLLHDVGLRYISIPYHEIELEELPENQRTEYRKHTVYGYSSIEKESWLDEISKNIILSHHEREDGSGYPFHTKKLSEEIGIVAVCDAFDEMVCGIGCRRMKTYKAIEYLKFFKNVKFNGKIVDEFLKILASYPVGSHVLLNTGMAGVVIRQNNEFPERPVLRILKDTAGNPIFKEQILDLLTENSVFIEDVIN